MSPPRISRTTGVMMIVCAGLVDFVQFLVSLLGLIPFIGPVIVITVNPPIDFVASIFFGIWFSHVGLSLMDSKRVFGFGATILVEFIPGLDAIPWWTFFIAYTVRKEWARKTDI